MRKSFWLVAGICLGGALLDTGSATSGAQAQTALTGQVSAREEGAMEGVLVSAKREGSTTTVTVVTDEQGRYAFPAAQLAPGRYAIAIRAVGYKLDGPKTAEVGPQGTNTGGATTSW